MFNPEHIHTLFTQYYGNLFQTNNTTENVSLIKSPVPTTEELSSFSSSLGTSTSPTFSFSTSSFNSPYQIVPKDGYTQKHYLYQASASSLSDNQRNPSSFFIKCYGNEISSSLLDFYTSLNKHVTTNGILRSTYYVHTPKLLTPSVDTVPSLPYIPVPSSLDSTLSSSVAAITGHIMVFEGLPDSVYQKIHEYIQEYGILDQVDTSRRSNTSSTAEVISLASSSSSSSSSSSLSTPSTPPVVPITYYSSSIICRTLGKTIGNLDYCLRSYRPTTVTRLIPSLAGKEPSMMVNDHHSSSVATVVPPSVDSYHSCFWDLRYFHEYFGQECTNLSTPNTASASAITDTYILQAYHEYMKKIVPLYQMIENPSSLDSTFVTTVAPLLQRSFIHSDLNDCNLFVHRKVPKTALSNQQISIIDWDDACYSYLIHESVIALTYLLIAVIQQVEKDNGIHSTPSLMQSTISLAITEYLSSYIQTIPLNATEISVLIPLIKVRLCTSILVSQASVTKDPSRAEYILLHRQPAEKLLALLSTIDWNDCVQQWQRTTDDNQAMYRSRPVASYVPYTKENFSSTQQQTSENIIETLLHIGQREGFGKVIDIPVDTHVALSKMDNANIPLQTIQGKVGYIPLTNQWMNSTTLLTTNPLVSTVKDDQRWSSLPFIYDFSARSVALTNVVGTDPEHLSQFTELMFEPLYSSSSTLLSNGLSSSSVTTGSILNKSSSSSSSSRSSSLQRIGWGQYFEDRIIYQSGHFINSTDKSLTRTLHLGVDLEAPDGTPLYCPYPGKIHSWARNTAELDYGPTIIIEHSLPHYQDKDKVLTFYTLYGHLSLSTIYKSIPLSHTTASLPPDYTCQPRYSIGQTINTGDIIGYIGPSTVNGGWPPHVHFQIQTEHNFGHWEGDYPGVCAPAHAHAYQYLTPDPNLILRCPFIAWNLPTSIVTKVKEST